MMMIEKSGSASIISEWSSLYHSDSDPLRSSHPTQIAHPLLWQRSLISLYSICTTTPPGNNITKCQSNRHSIDYLTTSTTPLVHPAISIARTLERLFFLLFALSVCQQLMVSLYTQGITEEHWWSHLRLHRYINLRFDYYSWYLMKWKLSQFTCKRWRVQSVYQ